MYMLSFVPTNCSRGRAYTSYIVTFDNINYCFSFSGYFKYWRWSVYFVNLKLLSSQTTVIDFIIPSKNNDNLSNCTRIIYNTINVKTSLVCKRKSGIGAPNSFEKIHGPHALTERKVVKVSDVHSLIIWRERRGVICVYMHVFPH